MKTLALLLIGLLLSTSINAQVLTSPVKTTDELAKEDAIWIANKTNRHVSAYKNIHNQLYKKYWRNGCEYAQKVADNFGNEAGKMFVNHALTTAHLQSIGQTVENLTPPCTVVDAIDGEAIDMDTTTISITGTFEGWEQPDYI